MRLKAEEVQAIKAAANEVFGPDAIVRLFGSRVNDALKGGDIDLHVEVDGAWDNWRAKDMFESALFRTMEPQRIDMVLSSRGTPPTPFEKIAYRDGVVL